MAKAPPKDDAQKKPAGAAKAIWSKLLILGVLLMLSVVGIPWVVVTSFQEPPPTQEELFDQSMEALEQHKHAEALKLVRPLQTLNYLDVDFSGGVDYIVGMIAFHDAQLMEGASQQKMYQMTVNYLRESERKGIIKKYYPQLTYALGKSLYQLNKTIESFEVLSEAYEINEEARPSIAVMLGMLHLNPNTRPQNKLSFEERTAWKIKRAGEFAEEALASGHLSTAERVEAFEIKALVAIQNRDLVAADEALKEYGKILDRLDHSDDHEHVDLRLKKVIERVLRGRRVLAGEDPGGAVKIFEEVISDYPVLENSFTRQACLLAGRCYQQLKDDDSAIKYYEHLLSHIESDEALVATLELADILRVVKLQHEKALDLYRQMLKRITDPDTFNNQWIAIEELQQRIRRAWDQWSISGEQETDGFRWAIVLSESMTPLFKTSYAYELTAMANVRWADQLEAQYARSPISHRVYLTPKIRERYLAAGVAFSKLAQTRKSDPDYPNAVWQASQAYLKGNDFRSGLVMIDEFINSRPDQLLATALVRKAEMMINLDPYVEESQLTAAEEILKNVVTQYKQDPINFRAQFLLGQVALEQNRTEDAIAAWRKLLQSSNLTPAAQEWEMALLSLGRTQYHTAEAMLVSERTNSSQANKVKQPQQEIPSGYVKLKESITRLDEFLMRYPDHEPANEVRWMLAKGLTRYTDFTRWQLENAETVNAKAELIRELRAMLEDSIAQYNSLKLTLTPMRTMDLLDTSLMKILRDSYFEPGHAEFVLGEFDESGVTYRKAIATYGQAINQFPTDPQVVLAYYQIAHCYDRLGRPDESVRQLQRAKVILQTFSEAQFTKDSTNYTLAEWLAILDQAIEVHRLTQNVAGGNNVN